MNFPTGTVDSKVVCMALCHRCALAAFWSVCVQNCSRAERSVTERPQRDVTERLSQYGATVSGAEKLNCGFDQ